MSIGNIVLFVYMYLLYIEILWIWIIQSRNTNTNFCWFHPFRETVGSCKDMRLRDDAPTAIPFDVLERITQCRLKIGKKIENIKRILMSTISIIDIYKPKRNQPPDISMSQIVDFFVF